MIRRCIPKGTDLGQYSQEQIDWMMSHINSYSRPSLGNKSPYDVFAFQYGEKMLKILNIRKIPADEIILTPDLFRKKLVPRPERLSAVPGCISGNIHEAIFNRIR